MGYKDIKGIRSGSLVAIKYVGKSENGGALWECLCDCGNSKIIRGDRITGQRVKSCGCKNNIIDLVNQKFGRLTALKPVKKDCSAIIYWDCMCECGKKALVRGDHLRSGRVKSCGCYGKEQAYKANKIHGESKSRLYNIWACMKKRCNNPNNKDFIYYGGKGINIYDEWCNSYIAFRDWSILNGYNDTLTLDRIDNNGNYEPNNCRWTTLQIQANNKSTSGKYVFEKIWKSKGYQ